MTLRTIPQLSRLASIPHGAPIAHRARLACCALLALALAAPAWALLPDPPIPAIRA